MSSSILRGDTETCKSFHAWSVLICYGKLIHRKRCFPISAHHVVDIMEDVLLFLKGMGVPYAARKTHTPCRSHRTRPRWGPLCRRKLAWSGWIGRCLSGQRPALRAEPV